LSGLCGCDARQPVNQPSVDMHLGAMVIHSERLAEDNFHIGIQYKGISKSDLNLLEEYVQQAAAATNG